MKFNVAAAETKRLQLGWDPEYFYSPGDETKPSVFATISIAFAPTDGKRNPFYAIAASFKEEWVPESHFVKRKVLPKLEPESEKPRLTSKEFCEQLKAYIKRLGKFDEIELIYLESSLAKLDLLALENFLGMDPVVFFEQEVGVRLVITNIAELQMEICLADPPVNEDMHHALSDAYWHVDFYHALLEYKRDVERGILPPVPPIEAYSALQPQ